MSEETIVIVCLIIGNFIFNTVLYEMYQDDFNRLANMLGRSKFALVFFCLGWLILSVTLIGILFAFIVFGLIQSLYTVFTHIFGKEQGSE